MTTYWHTFTDDEIHELQSNETNDALNQTHTVVHSFLQSSTVPHGVNGVLNQTRIVLHSFHQSSTAPHGGQSGRFKLVMGGGGGGGKR